MSGARDPRGDSARGCLCMHPSSPCLLNLWTSTCACFCGGCRRNVHAQGTRRGGRIGGETSASPVPWSRAPLSISPGVVGSSPTVSQEMLCGRLSLPTKLPKVGRERCDVKLSIHTRSTRYLPPPGQPPGSGGGECEMLPIEPPNVVKRCQDDGWACKGGRYKGKAACFPSSLRKWITERLAVHIRLHIQPPVPSCLPPSSLHLSTLAGNPGKEVQARGTMPQQEDDCHRSEQAENFLDRGLPKRSEM